MQEVSEVGGRCPHKRALLAFGLCLVGTLGPAARAAEPDALAQSQAATTVTITGAAERAKDDVVERRSRGSALFGTSNLREVPFTVNVITSQEIANRQAKTLGEALVGDPAVRNDYGGSGAYPTESFNIRGFSINSAGMLKDGMPMANQVTQSLENIDQVEVVRGPMGFRYGFIGPGGAINLVSKRPTPTPLRSFTFSTDEYGSAKAHVDLGGRVGDDGAFGYRVNAVYGAIKNFVRPIDIDRRLLAGTFDWRATPDTTLTIALDSYRYAAGPDVFHYTVPDVNGNEIKGIPPDRFFGQKFLPDNVITTSTGSLTLASKLAERLSLTSQFAVYDSVRTGAITLPTNAQPNGDFNMNVSLFDSKDRTLTNTTYLNLSAEALGLAHSLTGGFTFSRSRYEQRDDNFSGVLGGADTPFVNNFFDPRQFPDTTTRPVGPYVPADDNRERGFFVSDEMRWGEAWRFLVALRRSMVDNRGTFSPGKNGSTDPTVGLMFDVNPALSLYASHATGLEKGGIAPAGTTNQFSQLPAQKTKQIELGVKSDLGGDRSALTLDASLFRIEKAAEFVRANPDETSTYVQSGRQVHTGGEVRLIGRVLPGLSVSTGVQALKARLTGANAGQRPQNVPKVNFAFSGDWRVPALPGLTLTSAVLHSGEREINVPNIPAKAGRYTRLDAGARYEWQWGRHDLVGRFNVENVTDRAYYNVGWYSLYEFGAPRTVSASVEARF